MATARGVDGAEEEDLGPLPKEWLPDGVLDDMIGDEDANDDAAGGYAGISPATTDVTGVHSSTAQTAVAAGPQGRGAGNDLLGGDIPAQIWKSEGGALDASGGASVPKLNDAEDDDDVPLPVNLPELLENELQDEEPEADPTAAVLSSATLLPGLGGVYGAQVRVPGTSPVGSYATEGQRPAARGIGGVSEAVTLTEYGVQSPPQAGTAVGPGLALGGSALLGIPQPGAGTLAHAVAQASSAAVTSALPINAQPVAALQQIAVSTASLAAAQGATPFTPAALLLPQVASSAAATSVLPLASQNIENSVAASVGPLQGPAPGAGVVGLAPAQLQAAGLTGHVQGALTIQQAHQVTTVNHQQAPQHIPGYDIIPGAGTSPVVSTAGTGAVTGVPYQHRPQAVQHHQMQHHPGIMPPLPGHLDGADLVGMGKPPFYTRKGPSGPRRAGEGVEEEEQAVVSVEKLPGGGLQLCVTLLAAGFVIGASGASVREITQHTDAVIQSWTQQPEPGGYHRPTRIFRLQGQRKAVNAASEIIHQAVERYKELCEGKRRGEFVQRQQRIRGVEFAYQPPPRSAAPQAAALGSGRAAMAMAQAGIGPGGLLGRGGLPMPGIPTGVSMAGAGGLPAGMPSDPTTAAAYAAAVAAAAAAGNPDAVAVAQAYAAGVAGQPLPGMDPAAAAAVAAVAQHHRLQQQQQLQLQAQQQQPQLTSAPGKVAARTSIYQPATAPLPALAGTEALASIPASQLVAGAGVPPVSAGVAPEVITAPQVGRTLGAQNSTAGGAAAPADAATAAVLQQQQQRSTVSVPPGYAPAVTADASSAAVRALAPGMGSPPPLPGTGASASLPATMAAQLAAMQQQQVPQVPPQSARPAQPATAPVGIPQTTAGQPQPAGGAGNPYIFPPGSGEVLAGLRMPQVSAHFQAQAQAGQVPQQQLPQQLHQQQQQQQLLQQQMHMGTGAAAQLGVQLKHEIDAGLSPPSVLANAPAAAAASIAASGGTGGAANYGGLLTVAKEMGAGGVVANVAGAASGGSAAAGRRLGDAFQRLSLGEDAMNIRNNGNPPAMAVAPTVAPLPGEENTTANEGGGNWGGGGAVAWRPGLAPVELGRSLDLSANI